MERTRRLSGPFVLLAILCILLGETGCQSNSGGEADSPSSGGPQSGAPGIAGVTGVSGVAGVSGDAESEGAKGTAENAGEDAVAAIAGTSITREQLVNELMAEEGAQTLREMMLRIAVEQEADAKGIKITDEEVDQELRARSENYGGESSFYDAMQTQLGMNRDELRRDAKYQLELQELAIRSVKVADADIDRYIDEHQADFGPRIEWKLAHIVLPSEKQAQALLSRLEQGEDFAKLAKAYSTDKNTSDGGGDLGWVEADDPFADQALLEAAGELDVGQATGPVRTENGYEIVELNGKNEKPGMDAQSARREARRQVALSRAAPMADLEQSLLDKYQAVIFDKELKP
ncbi:peptidylprolyl isomerase [Cohnella zeiphila]|uniref:peptidylprolyl isomerase n=1 Tax=Cohnella zeiphila TaxID=2761120 RepID=A0A7X0SQQ3_9BACL|nr:peptidylprolyl isomerase [Cohnella zeiphila]MBB6733349.1 peptidylprolyl isomerase [Cohnella zeiphila]